MGQAVRKTSCESPFKAAHEHRFTVLPASRTINDFLPFFLSNCLLSSFPGRPCHCRARPVKTNLAMLPPLASHQPQMHLGAGNPAGIEQHPLPPSVSSCSRQAAVLVSEPQHLPQRWVHVEPRVPRLARALRRVWKTLATSFPVRTLSAGIRAALCCNSKKLRHDLMEHFFQPLHPAVADL